LSRILIGRHQASIFPAGDGFGGAISFGYDAAGKRIRVVRKARTKAALKEKLIQVVAEHEAGIKPDACNWTVADAVNDWLAKGLKGRSESTVTACRILAGQHVLPLIGAIKLRELTADHVDAWLDGLTGKLSSRSLQGVHAILKRSLRQAQARDKVMRNVADLVTTPKGRPGRPSRAMTAAQACALHDAARQSRLHAYVVISLLTGIRTEEARALHWDHVVAWDNDSAQWRPVTEAGFGHDRLAIYVWRSVRIGGDTKTAKSRRTLELPEHATEALRHHHARQAEERLAAGPLWRDHGLVFASQAGTPLDASHVRRSFKAITVRAGLGPDWAPRELRHSFVSIMSDHGVPIETIADLVGHASTAVTEEVYRHQLKPVITKGAETMNIVFRTSTRAASA
jgi:integrase